MLEQQDLRGAGDRIERLLDQLASTSDRRAAERAQELLALVSELYGAALARVLDIVRAEAPALLASLAGDELVASLLLVHGLHPEPLEQRVLGALTRVRPTLAAQGGDVELIDIDPAVGGVRVRLLGNGDGYPSSPATLQSAIEQAINEAAPEVVVVDVDPPPPPGPVPVRLGATPRRAAPAGMTAT